MRTIVIYSNCQCRGIKAVLEMFLKSVGEQAEFHLMENYKLIEEQVLIDRDLLARADVFIYQPIDPRYGALSTDFLRTLLPPHCVQVAFPYVYTSAYWIFYLEGIGFRGADVIGEMKRDGASLETVLQLFYEKKIDFGLERRFQESIAVLQQKELKCDIKASDFILANYRKHKLFLTQNHPSTSVYVHLVNQILIILGYGCIIDNPFGLPENLAGLRGNWPHSTYEVDTYRFQFDANCNNHFYASNIIKIYKGLDPSPYYDAFREERPFPT